MSATNPIVCLFQTDCLYKGTLPVVLLAKAPFEVDYYMIYAFRGYIELVNWGKPTNIAN